MNSSSTKKGEYTNYVASGLSVNRNYAEAWTAITLMNGEYVHWMTACRLIQRELSNAF